MGAIAPAIQHASGTSGFLTRPELEEVAETLAAQPELWLSEIDPHATVRRYVALHRDDRMDAWAIFWVPQSDTGWHDHDLSAGAVRVVEGALEEHALRVGGPGLQRTYAAGETFSFAPDHIHRLTCEVPTAVSIHVYSPALWRLGQYAVTDDGVLRRLSVSYADELRPMDGSDLRVVNMV
jgi:quercetin dioxygenase-like cupin family protein